MALTASIDNQAVKGNRFHRRGTITFDSSYPTGGEVFTAALFGLSSIDSLRLQQVGLVGGTTPHMVVHDKTAGKLLAFVVSTGAQVADTTNLSTLAVEYEVEGLC